MKTQNNNADMYKKLICDLVDEINDLRFLRQIYSILMREKNRPGR